MHAEPESCSMTDGMRSLAADDGAPYDFAEFERRAAMRRARPVRRLARPWRALRIAAVAAPVGLVLLVAAVSRGPEPLGETSHPVVQAQDVTEPALIEAGSFASISDLEDRIAWFDAMLSAPAPSEQRLALQDGRRAMAESLQQVRYAQAVLSY